MRSARRAYRSIVFLTRSCLTLAVSWQTELKGRARPGVRRGPQPSAVSFDDRTADRQTHTHAARLGGEEGVEHPVRIVGADPGTGVLHRQKHLVAFVLRSDQ